jgi:hypothetical protein
LTFPNSIARATSTFAHPTRAIQMPFAMRMQTVSATWIAAATTRNGQCVLATTLVQLAQVVVWR